jgi:putative hemolysin
MEGGHPPEMLLSARKKRPFPELTYANPGHPRFKRWFIRSVEDLSGRRRYAELYDRWRHEIAPTQDRVFGRMLELIGVGLHCIDPWPPAALPETPLVIVANHPFGIGDGIAALSLAERLGRPFKVMINAELLKIPEMAVYSLAIDFRETKEALQNNLAVRHEALRLLKEGVTIVVFPGGGVATAPRGFGTAEDLPWKMFPARLILEAGASVIPIYFSGQNGRLFHLVSQPMLRVENRSGKLGRFLGGVSLTLRTSLLIREFVRLAGKAIDVRIGRVISPDELAGLGDRKTLIQRLHEVVFALAPEKPGRSRHARKRLEAVG